MRVTVLSLLVMAAVGFLWPRAGAKERIQAIPAEEQTTIGVGQLARVSIPATYYYSVEAAGDSLVEVRRSKGAVIYRAVKPGTETILLSPDVPDGHCISCATIHYFVSVVAGKAE